MQHSRSGLYVDGHGLQASSGFSRFGDFDGFGSSYFRSAVVDCVSSVAAVLETSASVVSTAVEASSVVSSTVVVSSSSCDSVFWK